MTQLRIHLFGRFSMQCDGVPLEVSESRKVQELFCHLLLHHEQAQAREVLATLLWGENPTTQARKLLRHALWQLQGWLNQVAPTHAMLLRVEPEWVQFASGGNVWVDALLVRHTCGQVQRLTADQITPELAEELRHAVEVYRADLLDGWYQEWCLIERERFQSMHLTLLDKLINYHQAQDDYEAGLAYGEQILRLDQLRESTHRQMMQLYYLAGNRAGAMRQFERCVAALQEELGVQPSQRTVELYERIRGERTLPTVAGQERAVGEPALGQIIHRLHRLRGVLSDMQQELQRHLQQVDQVLNEYRH